MKEDQKKKDELTRRKQEREEKRLKKEEEKAKRMENKLKAKEIKKKSKSLNRKSDKGAAGKQSQTTSSEELYTCKICNLQLADPDTSYEGDTLWINCVMCDNWVHPTCVGLRQSEDLHKVDFHCSDCSFDE
ncbi:hypothetical protein KUTeg_015801 [Tegillarca granosa]|uniref:Zinc finger PHD-type domain-containing protein n=1 Tax=Tegillarca granosa TaxID=220873 RepID=A0ABQ9EJ31_TEGGR|nr:hypothetical protein KUTeg_015801 [Tegillarca granosa]